MDRLTALPLILIVALGTPACGEIDPPTSQVSPDGEHEDAIAGGKADGSGFTECELAQVVIFVNQTSTTYEALRAADVHGAAARRIPEHRDGPDGLAGTVDDDLFETIEELDNVPYVGPAAMRALVSHVADLCVVQGGQAEVIFSPQPYEESHLVRVVELLDSAETTADIAMYSLRDGGTIEAIERAATRGVSIRMILEAAAVDRREPEGTRSAQFEDLGIEVRWINKIMHHKFVIIDGPRDGLDLEHPGVVLTGSANWSYSAGTNYDENTIVLSDNAEASGRFQDEFNFLWDNGRLVEWNEEIPAANVVPVDWDSIDDDPAIEILFTSDNFEVRDSSRYGPTFSAIRGSRVATNRLVELIASAETSIHIASGHMRNRGMAEALIAALNSNPRLDVRIYLDGQEYVSASRHAREQRDLVDCLEEAGDSETRREDCLERGLHYGYALDLAGLQVRYKYYAYRWDYRYAPQMHHKYLLIDGRYVATGSYNYSDNAERSTMENLVILDGAVFPGIVRAFEDNFELLWATGQQDGLFEVLLDEIRHGSVDIPIVFDSMALDWAQVTELKNLIREMCPDVISDEFRSDAASHRSCPRD